MKRKCSAKQLRALAKGRRIRKANLRKRGKGKRKRTVRKKKPIRRQRVKRIKRIPMAARGLTGGTRDVNPQFYSGTATMVVANTPETQGFITPVAKGIFGTKGRATVMEILKVFIQFSPYPIIALAAETLFLRSVSFGSKDHGTASTSLATPDLFAWWGDSRIGAFTAAGTYCIQHEDCYEIDLTDDAGHGVLFAGDYMYVQMDTAGFGAVGSCMWKVLYRFKNIPLQEYIGIVQSQQ